MDQDRKDALVGRDCTLNGKRAVIVGRLNRFATIAALDGERYDYAWETVERIMTKKLGRFFS